MKFETRNTNVLGRLLDEKADQNKDKPFIYFEGEAITFKEMRERVNKVANGFVRMGIQKGTKIVFIMQNCPEYIYGWFALSKIGAIEVPISPFHKGSMLEYMINYSDAEILIISDNVIPQIREIEHSLKNIKRVIVHGSLHGTETLQFPTESYNNLFNNPASFPLMDVRHNDLMAIMFTSGTTGSSKGVMITHNHAIFVASQYAAILKLKNDDIYYHYVPLFHMAGQFAAVLAPLLSDGALVLKKGFSATGFWGDIKKYGCTVSGMFEAVINILFKSSETDDDADNTLRICAVAHVTPDMHERFEKRFGLKLVNVYGMTEGDATVSSTYDDIRIGSCGKPRGGYFDVRIFDSDDCELPSNKVGELVLRPLQPHIMFEGYYKMAEKTLEAFRNLWWHTGDLAYRDDQGYFYFVGREKDMIRKGGENISALEVETTLLSHPAVKECVAVAVESDLWGEELKVVVIPKEGCILQPEDLITFCDEKMAYFMVPRYIEFENDFPKTGASQRPIKNLLKGITSKTWDRVKEGVKIKREIEKH